MARERRPARVASGASCAVVAHTLGQQRDRGPRAVESTPVLDITGREQDVSGRHARTRQSRGERLASVALRLASARATGEPLLWPGMALPRRAQPTRRQCTPSPRAETSLPRLSSTVQSRPHRLPLPRDHRFEALANNHHLTDLHCHTSSATSLSSICSPLVRCYHPAGRSRAAPCTTGQQRRCRCRSDMPAPRLTILGRPSAMTPLRSQTARHDARGLSQTAKPVSHDALGSP
jgi:hypothetical protein